jgi:hypothetical protein
MEEDDDDDDDDDRSFREAVFKSPHLQVTSLIPFLMFDSCLDHVSSLFRYSYPHL